MPGHFLVWVNGAPSYFMDPFNGGSRLDESQCEEIFRSIYGPGSAFSPSFLAPVDSHQIIHRMLGNLALAFQANGDRESSLGVLKLRAEVPGGPPQVLLDLAREQEKSGRFLDAHLTYRRLARVVPPAQSELAEKDARRVLHNYN
jgi:hypothetical protein